jgi:hypothetical protein
MQAADQMTDASDREWWGRYAVNMALAASRAVELGPESDRWRADRIRKSAAPSWAAGQPG